MHEIKEDNIDMSGKIYILYLYTPREIDISSEDFIYDFGDNYIVARQIIGQTIVVIAFTKT